MTNLKKRIMFLEEFFGELALYIGLPYILQIGLGTGIRFTGISIVTPIIQFFTTKDYKKFGLLFWLDLMGKNTLYLCFIFFHLRLEFILKFNIIQSFKNEYKDFKMFHGTYKIRTGVTMTTVKNLFKKYLGIIVAVMGLAFLAVFIYLEEVYDLSKYENLNLQALVDLMIVLIAAFCVWAFWDNMEPKE